VTHSLIRDNISLLEQTTALVEQLEAMHYPAVGPHFRHVVDHYALFLSGLTSGVINYDERQRDTVLETCCDHLLARISRIVDQFIDIDVSMDAPVKVQCATCTVTSSKEELSTIGRELMFLHSHAVHHLAMITLKLEIAGVKVDPTIGLAPSTQRYYANLDGNLRAAS